MQNFFSGFFWWNSFFFSDFFVFCFSNLCFEYTIRLINFIVFFLNGFAAEYNDMVPFINSWSKCPIICSRESCTPFLKVLLLMQLKRKSLCETYLADFCFNQFSLIANPFVLCFWPNVGEAAKKFWAYLNVSLTVSFRTLFELASFVELCWLSTFLLIRRTKHVCYCFERVC